MKTVFTLNFKSLWIGLALVAGLGWSACQRVEPLPSSTELAAREDARIVKYLDGLGIEPSRRTKTTNGTYVVIDSALPSNPILVKGMTVAARYRGRVLDSTDWFDENLTKAEPLRFDLGMGDVVRGWDEGLPYFRIGEKGRLFIPSAQGYGTTAVQGIPANSILYFEVRVVNAQ